MNGTPTSQSSLAQDIQQLRQWISWYVPCERRNADGGRYYVADRKIALATLDELVCRLEGCGRLADMDGYMGVLKS